MKLIADVFGYVVTALSLVANQFSKKWQILLCNLFINLFAGISTLFLVGVNSASAVCFLAVVHTAWNIVHTLKNEDVSKTEKGLFLAAYLICGFAGFRTLLDILPVIGAIFFMISVICKREQHIRIFSICNGIVYVVYYGIIGSTSIYASIFSIIFTLMALYRYRKTS